MIVAIGFAIVAAGAVAKIYLVNQTCILQVAQRVVNSCVADTGQTLAGRLKDIAGGRVVVSFPDDLINRLSLRRQLWFLLIFLQDGFRLILNQRFVNRGKSAANNWVLPCEVNNAVDVSFKGWALDTVRSE